MYNEVGGQDKTEQTLDGLIKRQDELLKTLKSQVSKWDDNISGVKEEYKALKIAALKDAGKRIEADRLAKGVPIFTKGVLSMATAIKKKDWMALSAAIMDTCSGAAFIVQPPFGVGVGLFLNIIAQTLSFFVVQEPPLEDKIKKMLEHLKAGQQKENIAAVGHSIASYTDSLRTKCVGTTSSKGIAAILAMPLTS